MQSVCQLYQQKICFPGFYCPVLIIIGVSVSKILFEALSISYLKEIPLACRLRAIL